MRNKRCLIKLLLITLVITSCTTYQSPESYSIDASLNGSFDGEWYTSLNNQFRVKPLRMEPPIHIRDNYGPDGMGVSFASKASTFNVVVTSGKVTDVYNFDTEGETFEKHNGDSIKKRIPLSVFGVQGITYLMKYKGRGMAPKSQKERGERERESGNLHGCISCFEINGYLCQVIITSTVSIQPESREEKMRLRELERMMDRLLKNIEFTK
jgi:hypothetical protein